MLTAIRLQDKAKVIARAVKKTDAPFCCPSCSRGVILNKGMVRVHHFKHESNVSCPRGTGESEAHFQCKTAIFDALAASPTVSDVELEKSIGNNIADVFAIIRGAKVAIEVQKSVLSPQSIAARTASYEREGIFVLWIGLPKGAPIGNKYAPKAWEKWCHAAYMGRVYFWESGAQLRSYHFDSYAEHREEKTIFQRGGIERTVGGYDQYFKSARTPVPGPVLDIGTDFRPITLDPYHSKTLSIPRRRLFIDRHKPWWST